MLKLFRFFSTRIFLKKPILVVATILLMILASCMPFMCVRSVVSLAQGIREFSSFDREGTYVMDLDDASFDTFRQYTDESAQRVFDRLDEQYEYAVFVDGFLADLPNSHNRNVAVAYMNENWNEFNRLPTSTGGDLNFDYKFTDDTTIPVLVGRGLADDYPLGSTFVMRDPALDRDMRYEVKGVLADNAAHSNLKALDSKTYYNFSIIVPVNRSFLKTEKNALKINLLFDLVLFNAKRSDVTRLEDYAGQVTPGPLRFSSYQDLKNDLNQYYMPSMRSLIAACAAFIVLLVIVAVWSSLAGIRIMMRECTVNILVGLSYQKLRNLLFAHYMVLGLIAWAVVVALTITMRQTAWAMNDPLAKTLGWAGGLIPMDWIGLYSSFVVMVAIAALLAQIVTWRVKRIPISLGVLQ
ncbi:MAG: hypothetical protein SO053_03050 [Bifidobacterium animalis]|nr:hypothetical protein [Bifidobacterium animalis]MDY5040120.1 hypothetical protein [Bifidobacterium animalis]